MVEHCSLAGGCASGQMHPAMAAATSCSACRVLVGLCPHHPHLLDVVLLRRLLVPESCQLHILYVGCVPTDSSGWYVHSMCMLLPIAEAAGGAEAAVQAEGAVCWRVLPRCHPTRHRRPPRSAWAQQLVHSRATGRHTETRCSILAGCLNLEVVKQPRATWQGKGT